MALTSGLQNINTEVISSVEVKQGWYSTRVTRYKKVTAKSKTGGKDIRRRASKSKFGRWMKQFYKDRKLG